MNINILKEDLKTLYGLNIEEVKLIEREDRRPCYKVFAKEGEFFVKVYDELNINVIEGLKLLDYLQKQGFPAIKIYRSKRGNYLEVINNIPVALFEWVEAENVVKSRNINIEKSKNLGKALGLLHKLTRDYDFPEKKEWGHVLSNVIGGLFRCKIYVEEYAPNWYRDIFNEVLEKLIKWKIPENVPKAVLHGEFTFEHVLFKGNDVYKVIDWDPVNKGWRFQDLGITLFLTLGEFGEKNMYAILKGYEEIEPLTEWEKKNLNNILLFGLSTLLWWYTDGCIDEYCRWEGFNKKLSGLVLDEYYF